jgi:hypothetical protein
MQKKLKIFVTAAALAFTVVTLSYSAQLKDLQNGVVDFSEKMAKSLPFNSSLGLNWSDAYIGKIFPSVPPHFGIGGSFGFTTMDLPALKTLAGQLGYGMPFTTDRLFFPVYTLEGRLGGFFLPFDIGVKFGTLPSVGMWGHFRQNGIHHGRDGYTLCGSGRQEQSPPAQPFPGRRL